MSAYIVSRMHIHQLVTAIDTYVAPTTEPTTLGQMLWNANIASVQYRYDVTSVRKEDFQYEYVPPHCTLTPVEVYKIMEGFTYESCEHADWETSTAHGLIAALGAAIRAQLGLADLQIRCLPAYVKADYDIEDDEQRETAPALPKPRIRLMAIARQIP